MIYLDNAATTIPDPEVISHYNMALEKYIGNPASLHRLGIEAAKEIERCQRFFADFFNCSENSFVFTSGGTESNNMAIVGTLLPKKHRHKVLVSAIEHPSVLSLKQHVEYLGHDFEIIKVNNKGLVDIEDLKSKLDESVLLVSIMFVNNETGVIQPMKDIIQVVRSYTPGILIHSDMVQALGKVQIDFKEIDVDLASISAHKIGGLKGVGALYVKNKSKLRPIIFGGGQQGGLRSGTDNVAGISAFAKACEKKSVINCEKIKTFKSIILEALQEEDIEYRVNSPEESTPFILSISFYNFNAEVLVHALEDKGFFVSTMSACSSKENILSGVLRAMSVEDRWNKGTIRISFSSENKIEECKEFAACLVESCKRLAVFMK